VASGRRVIDYFRIAIKQLMPPPINGGSNRSEGKSRDRCENPESEKSSGLDDSK
jgi:hypothetical protein